MQALPGTLWNTIPQPALLLRSGLSKDTPIPAPGLVGKHGRSTGLRTVRLGHELAEFSWRFDNSVYRLTGNVNYLDTSRRLATYFLSNLPADGIVPWCVTMSSICCIPVISTTGISMHLWHLRHAPRILQLQPLQRLPCFYLQDLNRPLPQLNHGVMLLFRFIITLFPHACINLTTNG